MNPVIRKLHEAQLRKDLPDFRAGDTVKVNVRLLEGEGEKVKERIQSFEGVVISKRAAPPAPRSPSGASASAPASSAFSRSIRHPSPPSKSPEKAMSAAHVSITCAI